MSSLFQQAEANSTDKPSLTKYGHTTSGSGSGLDENSNTQSANQPQGSKEADATTSQQARTVKKSMSNAAKTRSGIGGEEQSGIEHFET